MKAKYINLLQYLNEQQDWVSSSHLAEKFSLSKRTIKTYMSEIQSLETGLVVASNKGYRVDASKLVVLLNNNNQHIPETPAERAAYLLLKLISADKPFSIYDLADELYISESTLLNDVQKLKKQCLEHSLELKQSKDALQLIGSEKAKRQFIHTTLLTELDNNFVDITNLQENFPNLDSIKKIVAEVFSSYDFFTNDYALTNIVIHLAIAVDRMQNNFQYPETNKLLSHPINTSIQSIAEEIAHLLASYYDIHFSKEEIQDLALLISANGTNINFTQVSTEELKQIADPRCLDLVTNTLDKVQELYFIDGNDSEFFIRFTLHLKNLLHRIDNGYSSRNPMTATLKKECPLIYDCAVQVSHVIQKELNHTISEDEIAYIAFHLGYALEIQKQRTNKINCTILVPHYYNMNIQILEKLKKNFADDLEIKNILTDEKELQYVTTELIISAVKLKQVITTPYVIINPFFTTEDRKYVTQKIFSIKENKRKDSFTKNFLAIANKKHFLFTTEAQSFDTLLQQLCNEMENDGLVDKHFYSQVMEREQLSSTAFGSVAIPHSLTMDAKQTGISIVVNPNGIQWGNSKVTLVFLISINYRNRYIFREIFDDLAIICTDEQHVQKLSRLTSFEEFIDVLIQCFAILK